jgi:predicted house-cleaning noncanonical NTP pyrophosphatase (MazG superfamily)
MEERKLLQYLINVSDVTVQKKQEATEYLAELEEYKKLYNEVAEFLNTANHKLSQISTLANRRAG